MSSVLWGLMRFGWERRATAQRWGSTWDSYREEHLSYAGGQLPSPLLNILLPIFYPFFPPVYFDSQLNLKPWIIPSSFLFLSHLFEMLHSLFVPASQPVTDPKERNKAELHYSIVCFLFAQQVVKHIWPSSHQVCYATGLYFYDTQAPSGLHYFCIWTV